MDKKSALSYWLQKAEKDIKTTQDLFKARHYDWSLFIWHLVIEKLLKAKIISQEKEIIYTHDLARLAKYVGLKLNKELISQLNEITTFNIEARYDDYKLTFYKKANLAYCKKWTDVCMQICTFIKQSL